MTDQALIGVDGCRAGWLAVWLPEVRTTPEATIVESFAALLERFGRARCIAVDIPIGLPDEGARACDTEARQRVRPRGSSVFPAPLRPLLRSPSYKAASATRREIEGKGLSQQAYAILPKIAEVDAALRGDAEARKSVCEIHPELSFRVWAEAPVMHPKRTAEGKASRAALIEAQWPGAIGRCAGQLGRSGGWARDDLHDAFAALWTATRIAMNTAIQIPATPVVDAAGLPMRMFA